MCLNKYELPPWPGLTYRAHAEVQFKEYYLHETQSGQSSKALSAPGFFSQQGLPNSPLLQCIVIGVGWGSPCLLFRPCDPCAEIHLSPNSARTLRIAWPLRTEEPGIRSRRAPLAMLQGQLIGTHRKKKREKDLLKKEGKKGVICSTCLLRFPHCKQGAPTPLNPFIAPSLRGAFCLPGIGITRHGTAVKGMRTTVSTVGQNREREDREGICA